MMAPRSLDIPPKKSAEAKAADDWTNATVSTPAVEAEPTKKLSLLFPESVHRKTKSGAAERGHTMLGEIVEMCRARNGLGPWPADIVESVLRQVAEQDEATEQAGAAPRKSAPRKTTASRRTARGS